MDTRDLRYIKTDNGDCYRITDSNGINIWWCPINIKYYRQTNILEYISEENIYWGQDGNQPEQPDQIGSWYKNQWSSSCKKVTEDLSAILTYSNLYRVTYKQDSDGSQFKTELLSAGSSVSYPEHPAIENYTFIGWDPEYITNLQSDTTVIAKYSKNEILIDSISGTYKYDENYHPFLISAHLNNDTGTPTIYYSHDNKSWTIEPYKKKDQNTTLTVYYKLQYENYPEVTGVGTLRIENAEIFSVTFNYKQTNGEEASYVDRVSYGQSATEPTIPEPPAYEFTNWDKSFSKIYQDTEVNAVYTRRTIYCDVYSSLSTSHTTYSCYYGDPLNPVPVCDHTPSDRYAYQKWYTYKNNEAVDVNESELQEFTQNGLSVYPLYRRKYYVQRYVLSSDEPELYGKTYDVLSGSNLEPESIEVPQTPEAEFSEFDPTEWNPINSDTNLTMVYSTDKIIITYHDNIPFVLTLNGNGGVLDTEHGKESYNLKTDDNYPTIYNPSYTGHNFLGWSKESASGSEIITTTGKCPFTTDTTIYAQWNPITYYVQFDGNGATSGQMDKMTCSYGTKYNLTTNTFEKQGYSFSHWVGSNGINYQNEEEIINLTTEDGQYITMTAQWIANTYNVTFETNGGTIQE